MAAAPAVLVLIGFGAALSVIDARTHRLPNPLVAVFAVLAAGGLVWAAALLGEWSRLAVALGSGVVCLVILGSMAVLGSGLGMGDAKLGAVVGAYLGWFGPTAVMAGLLAAFVLGAGWALARVAARRGSWRSAIAFGPFLLLGVPIGAAVATVAA